MKHSHYKRDVSHLNTIDVYRIIDLFGVTCPVAQHVLKKSLAAGQRGHKDLRKDWQDIMDSAERRLQMLDEDYAAVAHLAEPAAEIDDESDRIQAIGQNGNGGEHYAAPQTIWPDWASHRLARIDPPLRASQFAQECNGAYLSVKGKAFNMNLWRVVESRPCAN